MEVGIIKKNKLGRKQTSYEGYELEIVEYRSDRDLDVRINDKSGYLYKHVSFWDFKNGILSNPLHPTVRGIGYYGVRRGQATKIIEDRTLSKKCLSIWRGIIERCYSERSKRISPSYNDVTVSDDWHDYRSFAKWFMKNYYEIDGEKMELDKDILIKGNKIYSPKACVFAPRSINGMFINTHKKKEDLPVGVSFHTVTNKFRATCSNPILGEVVYIGTFEDPKDAFCAYKQYKESIIKRVADKWNGIIPDKLYDALYSYTIEIDD